MGLLDRIKIGDEVSFHELEAEFGSDMSYVFREGKPVTAFILDKELNPSVDNGLNPDEIRILVGEGNQREAIPNGILLKHRYPIFIKEATNRWYYIGQYCYVKTTTNHLEVLKLSKDAKKKARIAFVIHLDKFSIEKKAAA